MKDSQTRYNLVWHLGIGIDRRGGDSVGYAASTPDKMHVGKKPGYWTLARKKFITRAASGHASLLHSRFATCGKKVVSEAHPFCIRRDNRTVLYGAHNGMVYNAYESAKKNNRSVVVDSEEIFQLMADKDYDGIRNLEGYGVVTTIDPKDPMTINALRLSDNSDIYVVRLESGGIVYGSTKTIVNTALEACKLTAACYYELEIGRIYHFRDDGVYKSNDTDIKFTERKWNYYGRSSYAPSWLDKASDAAFARKYGFDWNDAEVESEPAWKAHLRELKEEQEDRKKLFGTGSIITEDGKVEFEIETGPDTEDPDKCTFSCEACGNDVDEDEADYCMWQYEEYFGRKDAPIMCTDCLFDAGNAAASVG